MKQTGYKKQLVEASHHTIPHLMGVKKHLDLLAGAGDSAAFSEDRNVRTELWLVKINHGNLGCIPKPREMCHCLIRQHSN